MNTAINFIHYLGSIRQEQALNQKQSLSLVRPDKVRKSRLRCEDREGGC